MLVRVILDELEQQRGLAFIAGEYVEIAVPSLVEFGERVAYQRAAPRVPGEHVNVRHELKHRFERGDVKIEVLVLIRLPVERRVRSRDVANQPQRGVGVVRQRAAVVLEANRHILLCGEVGTEYSLVGEAAALGRVYVLAVPDSRPETQVLRAEQLRGFYVGHELGGGVGILTELVVGAVGHNVDAVVGSRLRDVGEVVGVIRRVYIRADFDGVEPRLLCHCDNVKYRFTSKGNRNDSCLHIFTSTNILHYSQKKINI